MVQPPNEPAHDLEVSKVHTRGQIGDLMMHLVRLSCLIATTCSTDLV